MRAVMSTALRLSPELRYLDAVEAALAHVLRDATLAEPRASNPDRALKVLALFVETMAGFALGAIARQLAAAMRSWFGDDGAATMRAALHRWPCARHPVPHEAGDTLAAEALARLRVRFALANVEARCLVDAIPNKPMTGMMFDLLAKEDTLAPRIARELAVGWQVYTSAITTRRYPPMTPLWQAWQHQLDGRPPPARTALEEAGYIMLVR